MKNIIKTVCVYIGLLIGAGFASGREILEYFNFKSNTNFSGIIISAFLFCFISYIIMSKASENRKENFYDYIDSVTGKTSSAIKYFMLIYMFCGMFVMFAGSGALVYSLSTLPEVFGCVLMAIICFVVMSFDLKGIISLNVILVPLMICGILYISFCIAVFGNTSVFYTFESVKNGAILSAICYCSYNTVTAGSVLVPLASRMKRNEIKISSLISGLIIGLLILVVWLVQGINFDIIWDSELPMMELSALCGKFCKKVYTTVLFMSICTTAVSYGFGLMIHFSNKIKSVKDRILFSAIICLCALPPAMYGFSILVSKLYSFFGYIGMIWMMWIIIDRYK